MMDRASGASGAAEEQPAAAAPCGPPSISSCIGSVGELPLSAPMAQYGVFINNVPVNVDEEALKALFKPYGQVQRLIVVHRPEFTSHAFAYVLMDTDDGTKRAIQQLNGVWFGQQRLKMEPTFGKATHIFGVAEGSNYTRSRVAAQEEQERRSQGRQNFRDRPPQSGDRWRGGFADRHRLQGERGGGHRNFQYNGRQNFRYGERRDGRFGGDHRGNRQGGYGYRWNRGGGHGDGPWRQQQGDQRGEGRLQDQLEQETAPRLRDAWNRQLEREAHWPSFEQLLESLADVYYDQMPPRDLRLAPDPPPPEDARPRSLWAADDGSPEGHEHSGHGAWTEVFVLLQSSLRGVHSASAGETPVRDGQRGSQASGAVGTDDEGLSGGGTLDLGEESLSGCPGPRYNRPVTAAAPEKASEHALPYSQRGDHPTRAQGQQEPTKEPFGAEGESCESESCVAGGTDGAATKFRVDHAEAVASNTRSADTGATADEPVLAEGRVELCRDEIVALAGAGPCGRRATAPELGIASDDAALKKAEGVAAEGDDVLSGEASAAPQKVGEQPVGSGPRPVSLNSVDSEEEPCGDCGAHKSRKKRRCEEAGNFGSDVQGSVDDAATSVAFSEDLSEGSNFADVCAAGSDDQTTSSRRKESSDREGGPQPAHSAHDVPTAASGRGGNNADKPSHGSTESRSSRKAASEKRASVASHLGPMRQSQENATNEAAKLPGVPPQKGILKGASGRRASNETAKRVAVHFDAANGPPEVAAGCSSEHERETPGEAAEHVVAGRPRESEKGGDEGLGEQASAAEESERSHGSEPSVEAWPLCDGANNSEQNGSLGPDSGPTAPRGGQTADAVDTRRQPRPLECEPIGADDE